MTSQEIHPGLEGIDVAETRLSMVDGANGELVIGGYPVEALAPNATAEQTMHLLWHGQLPDDKQHATLRDALAHRRSLGRPARAVLREAAGDEVPPMDALRMAAATISHGQPDTLEDHRQDATRVVARLPTALARYWRLVNHQDPIEPRQDLGHVANLLYMLDGETPTPERVDALETYINTVSDHGLNASTFTARVIVSTRSDVGSAVTGAIGALKGPLHGGAPGPVLEMLETVHETQDPEAYVQERLEAGERLMGFGHRVYRVRDPRAAVLSRAAERFYEAAGQTAFLDTAHALEEVATEALDEAYPERKLRTNVEFYTALLLHGLGLPRALFTPTFAIARAIGWTAHCLEQIQADRLIRPSSVYTGPRHDAWPGEGRGSGGGRIRPGDA